MRHAKLILIFGALAFVGCNAAREAPPPPPPPTVSVAPPVSYPVTKYFEYNGYLDSVESVQIRARVKGFLTEIRFTEGEEVKQGDLLFRIDPREYEVNVKRGEADRLKATAELRRARADEERGRQILASKAISQEEFAQRVAARETAEAVVKQIEAVIEAAHLELGYTEIRSPIDGQINRTLVTRGNLVGQGEATLLTTIVSTDPLFVYFDAPERDLVEYQRQMVDKAMPLPTSREFDVDIGVATEEGYPHRGKIDFRENRVDITTGTVRVRGRIPNPPVSPRNTRLLYPGLYARVRVPSGAPEPRLVIPEDALMTGQEGRFVYVLGPDNVVQKRTVTVGTQVWKRPQSENGTTHGWLLVSKNPDAKPTPLLSVVAIDKGLQPGDRVIVNGLTKARPGAPVKPDEWVIEAPPAPKPPAAQ